MRPLISLLVLSVLTAAPSLAQKTVTLGGDDNYSSQTLNVGDKLIIKLGVDRSSGYSWQPAALEGAVLQQDAVHPRQAPGKQVFEFTAAGPGVTTLTLNNVKKADPSHPLQIFSVMVGVSSPHGQEKADFVVGKFVGAQPCADCNGVEVAITFYAHGPNQFVDTIYKRKISYLGKDKVAEDSGTWVMLPGTAADPTATVYALTPNGGQAQEFYWLKSTDELVPLDAEKKPQAGPMDLTLHLEK
jgi:predicted secreted protein